MTDALVYRFGSFSLVPDRRTLIADDEPVRLGSRAMDLLQALVERRGRVVGKDELLALVWPGLVVQENNLQVQVAVLRRLLGRPAISTVPGRGYRFTMPVEIVGRGQSAPSHPSPGRGLAASDLIGREQDLEALLELLAREPLVTLTGAGGVGKTRLARAAGDRLAAGGRLVGWVDLAPLTDRGMIVRTVGRALGVMVDGADDGARALIPVLRERAPLLVLDNAEHLLESVSALVEWMRSEAPEVRLMVTSQELLRVGSEQVFRVDPLALPQDDGLEAAAASDAVKLFVLRARAAEPRFRLDAGNAPAAVNICRRLDGIPLALELAAGRTALLGVEGVHSRLSERFDMLTGGSRIALRRHQTLRAALEWTYNLLDAPEQSLFRQLGCFVGGFSPDAVQALCSDEAAARWEVLDRLGSLVDKSIVIADGGAASRYRMLETTRLFALEQLANAGETATALRRHAQAMADLLAARSAWPRRWLSSAAEFDADAADVDNARAALNWASTGADVQLAYHVAASVVLAFIRADLVNDYLNRTLGLRCNLPPLLPAELSSRFWLGLARAGIKSASQTAFDAAARAAAAYRRAGDVPLLYEALACMVLIAVNRQDAPPLEPLVAEMAALEAPDWPPAAVSFGRWAHFRMLRRAGQDEAAWQVANEQVLLSRQRDPLFTLRIEGVNLVDCEIALGRLDDAEARARRVLERLADAGVDDGRIGPVYEGLSLALMSKRRFEEALSVARKARQLLATDGDDLRLLEPLAWLASQTGQAEAAARVCGHVDAAFERLGLQRWPAAAARRLHLDAHLESALGAERQALLRRLGQTLSREGAYALLLNGAGPADGSSTGR